MARMISDESIRMTPDPTAGSLASAQGEAEERVLKRGRERDRDSKCFSQLLSEINKSFRKFWPGFLTTRRESKGPTEEFEVSWEASEAVTFTFLLRGQKTTTIRFKTFRPQPDLLFYSPPLCEA